jgi:hypothetical protein
MVRCGSKNIHQKDMCLEESALCVQIMWTKHLLIFLKHMVNKHVFKNFVSLGKIMQVLDISTTHTNWECSGRFSPFIAPMRGNHACHLRFVTLLYTMPTLKTILITRLKLSQAIINHADIHYKYPNQGGHAKVKVKKS